MNTYQIECISEPRGELQLEGFQCGDKYQVIEAVINGKKVYDLYSLDPHLADHPYLGTTSTVGMKRYFKKSSAAPKLCAGILCLST